ncbi:hypothetical protein JWG39_02730 [Desulforhopalus vacuolatus]|uniref:hypothetical protein n=1 Tax=Desulforhopalus vacuolatus TaxID=40414 RepID=UPI00196460A9|nr:hypothetical protein [Desulforhopalus vacuolatus]MBM9518733.1 hypothetical protein [Desulforhopalus vacuolatus]
MACMFGVSVFRIRLQFHRYGYVYRHRVDKACLVSTSLLESLLWLFFTNDV